MAKNSVVNDFLGNFDPEKSARERRKLNRKSYFMNRKSKNIYNERGQIAATGKDLCDCLDETCPGCHFPCSKCSSSKCGHECRLQTDANVDTARKHSADDPGNHTTVSTMKITAQDNKKEDIEETHMERHKTQVNRKWMYDKIEIEGNDFVIKNEYKHK